MATGLGLGIAGSAIGTVIAQWGMVAVYLIVIARHAARATPWPDLIVHPHTSSNGYSSGSRK